MRELVVSSKGHLQCDSEGLDEHDRNGAGCGANRKVNERVLAAVLGCNLIDHEDGEDSHEGAVEEKACQVHY